MLSKFSFQVQHSWNKLAGGMKRKSKEAQFSDLVDFIEMQTCLVSNADCSRDAFLETKDKDKRPILSMKTFSNQIRLRFINKRSNQCAATVTTITG